MKNQHIVIFRLFNNTITNYLPTDILEQIQHETAIIIMNQVKLFKLIMNNSNVVMEWFLSFGTDSFD